MRIAVIGAGAIGNLIAGYLKLKGENVYLIGHPSSVKAIRKSGLAICGVRGDFNVNIDIFERLGDTPHLAILAVKAQDIEQALKNNLSFLKNSSLLTTQNGIQAYDIVSKYVPEENIISSIVMFGATYLEPSRVMHNFEGKWIIGKMYEGDGRDVLEIQGLLNKIFPTVISDDIKGMKFLKVFVNANNCIAAILGVSMQEAFSDLEVSRISIAVWKEGLDIVGRSRIKLMSLPGFPLERLMGLTAMPVSEAAEKFSSIMVNLSKEPLYGSILQSIKRGRSTEIDYINGEFVNAARSINQRAPLNEKLVEMVHAVERENRFFSKEELISQTKGLVN